MVAFVAATGHLDKALAPRSGRGSNGEWGNKQMNSQFRSWAVDRRRLALLIDADNIAAGKLAAMLAELEQIGSVCIRRAYGNWANPGLGCWKDKLLQFAVQPVQQFDYSPGKNATDIALVIDAMELLHLQCTDAFCLASSDADFTPLAMYLRSRGHDVYGCGERKTPLPFVRACTHFFYLDSLEAAAPAKVAPPPASPPAVPVAKSLAGDTTLVTALRGAVASAVTPNGWAPLAAAGSAVRAQTPIDPKQYGARNFSALFTATGLFEIVKLTSGQAYIADKRNTARTPQP